MDHIFLNTNNKLENVAITMYCMQLRPPNVMPLLT